MSTIKHPNFKIVKWGLLCLIVHSTFFSIYAQQGDLPSDEFLVESYTRIIREIYPNLPRKVTKKIDDIKFRIDSENITKSAFATEDANGNPIIYINRNLLNDCVNVISSLFIDSLAVRGFNGFYTRELYFINNEYLSPVDFLLLNDDEAIEYYFNPLQSDYGMLFLLQTINFIIVHEVAHHVLNHSVRKKKILKIDDREVMFNELKKMEFEADEWARNALIDHLFFEYNLIIPIMHFWVPDVFLNNYGQSTTIGERIINMIKIEIDDGCSNEILSVNRCVGLDRQLKYWMFIDSVNNVFEYNSSEFVLGELTRKVHYDSSYNKFVDIYHFLGLSHLQNNHNIDSALHYFQIGANITDPKISSGIAEFEMFETEIQFREKCALLSAIIYENKKSDTKKAVYYYELALSSSSVFPQWFYERKINQLIRKKKRK